MERDGGSWTAEVPFLERGSVYVRIDGGSEAPPGWAEACYRTLQDRFAALEPDILANLFALYRRHGPPAGCPDPRTPEELGGLLVIDEFHLSGPTDVSIAYGFRDGLGWDDAMFSVGLGDWRIVRTWLDD